MKPQIIVFDFAGTLIKPSIVDEANELRSQILQRSLPSKQEHAREQKLYQVNREFVEKLTGLPATAKVQYRLNDLHEMTLSGAEVQNQIATNLFQIGMYMVAHKYKEKIFVDGVIHEIKTIKEKGYKIAIVSGVRTDIISGMLNVVGVNELFDYSKGQPPKLGMSNDQLLAELQKEGTIVALIGDKLSDIAPAQKIKAKAIFVTWGTPSGKEEELADKVVMNPKELSKLF